MPFTFRNIRKNGKSFEKQRVTKREKKKKRGKKKELVFDMWNFLGSVAILLFFERLCQGCGALCQRERNKFVLHLFARDMCPPSHLAF